MQLMNDIRHLSKAMQYGLKTRPSRVSDEEKMRRMKQYAFRRAKALRPQNYYPGADGGEFRADWSSTVTSAVQNIRTEYKSLCARSELAYRTDVWAKRAIQVLASFVVGQGIKPYPIIKMNNGSIVEKATAKLAQDWERFNDQGVRSGTQQITMYEAQSLEFKTIAVYGNSLYNVVSSRPGSHLRYALQFIKPTRLDFSKDTYFGSSNYEAEPKQMIVHGIEINSYGEPVNFYIEGQEKPISASRMGINYYPLETEMYIGVPWMAQSLEHVWDNQQIFSDKMKQSRIGARLGYKFPKSIRDEMDVATESVTDDGDDFFAMEFQGGLFSDQEIQPIKLDDTLKESFLPLVRHNLIALGAGIGFSYQTLTCDLEGMNFAASRANIINDNRFFRALYKWYTKTVLQRRWEKFVEWEILQGKVPGVTYQNFLDDPWYYTQCYWLPMDGEDWVDPLKDAEALKLLYGLGQVTYQEICAMSGKDYRSTYAQLVKERDMFKADGMDHLMPQIKAAAPAAQAVADPNNQDGGDGQ